MKVLALSNCLLEETQGSGYVIINTARCLQSLGYMVDLIPPSEFTFIPALKNRAKIYRMALGMAKWIYQKRSTVRQYDLIVFYGAESSMAIFLMKKVLKVDIPILLHSNGIELSAINNLEKFKACDIDQQTKKWYHFNNSFLFKYCYKAVNAILTVSRYDADFLKNNLNIRKEKVFFIEPSLSEVYLDRANYSPKKDTIITYCGRWTSHKGRFAMEFAIPKVLNKYPDFIFRIIGAGDDFHASEYFRQELLDKIEVYPYIKNKEQLFDLYSSTSIFLFPSLTEGFGLVVIEAMINGCAVICGPTGVGGYLKNFDEAIVLNFPDGEAVFAALELLILNNPLKLKLSLNGKKRAQKNTWGNFCAELVKVLDYLVSNK